MTKPSRSAARSLRSALVPAAMIAAFAASSLGGEREASATIASSFASTFITNAITCTVKGASNWGMCLLAGDVGGRGLTSTDIESIQGVVADELDAQELSDLSDELQLLVYDVPSYSRNSGSTETSSLDTAKALYNRANSIVLDLKDFNLDGSSSYAIAAAIRVAFAREVFDIMMLRYNDGGTFTKNDFYLQMTQIKKDANDAATQLTSLSGMVDSAVSSVVRTRTVVDNRSNDCNSSTGGGVLSDDRGDKLEITYCFSNPMAPGGKTCNSYRCCETNFGSGLPRYNTAEDNRQWTKAKIAQQQARMDYRAATVGSSVYEQIKTYNKIATAAGLAASSFANCQNTNLSSCTNNSSTSNDLEYCSNGVCNISEIGPINACASDCVANSDYATFDVNNTSHTIWNSSTSATLLQNSDAYLTWNNSNLQIKTWSGSVVWETRTGSTWASPAGTSLVLQSDGNFVIYSSSTPLWSTGTVTKISSGTTIEKGQKIVLLGKVLHVIDGLGNSLWNSETSNANYTELHQPFCYSKSEARTLISTDQGKLNWQADGNLALYRGTTQVWGTGTNGQAEYVCMQEDGNFIIYNNQYTKLWSTGSYGLPGAYLSMKDSRLRVSNAADNPIWTVNYCTQQGAACNDDGQQKFVAMDGTCYQASQHKTVLRADDSALVFQSDGNLVLYKEDGTGAVRWASGTSGAANKLCLQADGNLVIYNGSNPLWHSSTYGNSSATLQLAGCNLSINKAASGNTSDTLWTTRTSCE